MYRDYMEKEAEYKYKAVCILLAIIFWINCGGSIWVFCPFLEESNFRNKQSMVQL